LKGEKKEALQVWVWLDWVDADRKCALFEGLFLIGRFAGSIAKSSAILRKIRKPDCDSGFYNSSLPVEVN